MNATESQSGSFIATSQTAAAAFFGITTNQLRVWIDRGCPATVGGAGQSGEYDLQEMLAWAKANVWRPRQNSESGDGEDNETEAELKREKLRIDNERRRLQLELERGELVRRDSILAEFMEQNAIIRSRIEALPGELAASYPPEMRVEMIADARHKVNLLLKDLEGKADGTHESR